MKRKPRRSPIELICPTCKTPFLRRPSVIEDRKNSRFCSKKCYKNENAVSQEWLKSKCVIDTETGCWNWQGSLQRNGYGKMMMLGKVIMTHRLSAFLFLSFDLSSELCVLHKCDNRQCCNPEHLFFGSKKDNGKDMREKQRSLCGERNNNAKATKFQVLEIREKAKAGESFKKLAEKYSLSVAGIDGIVKRRRWKHLP